MGEERFIEGGSDSAAQLARQNAPSPPRFYRRGSATAPGPIARESRALGPARTTALHAVAEQLRLSSPAMAAKTALVAYLARVGAERWVRVGEPWLEPTRAVHRPSVDPVVPLEVEVSDVDTFATLAAKTQAATREALRHVPPLPSPSDAQSSYDVSFRAQEPGESSDALTVWFCHGAERGEVVLQFDFRGYAFDATQRGRAADHLVRMIDALIGDPQARYAEVDLLSPEERALVVTGPNETARAYPEDARLHELVEAQCRRTPDATAVVYEAVQLNYRELARRADALATELRRLGAGPDVPVGVHMERSVELVVALLATLKAGGGYLPLEPTYPAERVAHMIAESRAPIVLTQTHLRERLPPSAAGVLAIDPGDAFASTDGPAPPPRRPGIDDLAYLIFTSGSTGQPKGVINTHRGICNRLLWMQEEYGLTARDRVLQKTPFSFDVSVWEFFWPLMTGACLVVARPEGHKDPVYLADVIRRERVTTVHFVPSMLEAFLQCPEASGLPALQRVICSGEALRYELQERFFATMQGDLHNLYGPTEAAIDVTAWRCDSAKHPGTVPIGYPIANTQIYVLDRTLRPVPPGIAGEIYIAGAGLARGYTNPALTAERFFEHCVDGARRERLYRTGDVGRQLSDGALEYLGRVDHQVKLRGFRIELGEIEVSLMRLPAVREAVVVVRDDRPSGPELVAYVTRRGDAQVDPGELRTALERSLPEYMVPRVYLTLERLPTTAHGKVDRSALPAPPSRVDPIAPRTDLERTLATIWAEVLGLPKVGVHDDFFDLGGHSLLAVELMHRIKQEWGCQLPLATLYEASTVTALAEQIRNRAIAKGKPVLVPMRDPPRTPPLFLIHPAGGQIFPYHRIAVLTKGVGTWGVQAEGATPLATAEDMCRTYAEAILAASLPGPHLLGGWSGGGLLAVGVAAELLSRGKPIASVVLIDALLQGGEGTPPEIEAFADVIGALGGGLAVRLPEIDDETRRALGRQLVGLTPDEQLRIAVAWAESRGLLASVKRPLQLSPLVDQLALVATHRRMLRDYRPPVIDAPLWVWWARDRAAGVPVSDWRPFTRAAVIEHEVAGDHFTILHPPRVGEIARRIDALLAAAQGVDVSGNPGRSAAGTLLGSRDGSEPNPIVGATRLAKGGVP